MSRGNIARLAASLNSPRVAMSGLGLLLSAIGAQYEWIRLVFTTVNGFSVGYVPYGANNPGVASLIPQGLIFLLVILSATLAEAFGCARIRSALAGLALCLLFYHLLYLACIDPLWIETYVAQASSFQRQNDFLSANFVPNSGADILIRLNQITNFEFLYPDRLVFVWQSLGRGWILALAGTLLVATAPSRRAAKGKLFVTLAACAPVVLAGLVIFGGPALWGEYLHRSGDRLVARGAFGAAMRSYADAVAADPVLARSVAFVLKVSKTHYALNGSNDPYALLHLANADIQSRQYDAGFARLKILSSLRLDDSLLGDSYLRAAAKVERTGYISRGSAAYRAGDKVQAERDLQFAMRIAVAVEPEPLDVHSMLARIELDTRQYAGCASRAQRLLGMGTISHQTTLADLKSTAGDCYVWMSEYQKARDAYFESFKLDDRSNYRAYQALSGS